MESFLILGAAGLSAGFVAGLVGVGGGIIFAPVLLFYFHSTGVVEPVLMPLTLGTSLLCTLLTSSVSAFHHYRRGAVIRRVAILTGGASAAGVVTVTFFVTTQPWYDQDAFQLVFSLVLLVVAARMVMAPEQKTNRNENTGLSTDHTHSIGRLAAVGTAAGAVSSAVGVGGGVVLVPAFNRVVRLPIHTSVGTSSAAIIIISLLGVITYVASGLSESTGAHNVGYVDPITALSLSIPAAFTTRVGVTTAHRFNQRALRIGFAVFALIVAARLTLRALAAY